MNKKSIFKNLGWEFTFLLLLLGFLALYYQQFNYQPRKDLQKFQKTFLDKSAKLDRILQYEKHRLEHFGLKDIWERKVDDNVILHIYRNDSLKFWNSNEMPILRFAEIHFPSEGVLHLQNGWYYSKNIVLEDVIISASFLIKHDYAHQNKELQNEFAKDFQLPFYAQIELNEGRYNIKDQADKIIFNLDPSDKNIVSEIVDQTFFALIIALLLVLSKIHFKHWGRKRSHFVTLLSFGLILGLLRFTLNNTELNGLAFFGPTLFALNELITNYFDFIILIIFIYGLLYTLKNYLENSTNGQGTKILSILVIIGFFPFWYAFVRLLELFVNNSNFTMKINEIFELNVYSLVGFIAFGAIFHAYFKIIVSAYHKYVTGVSSTARYYALLFVLGTSYFIWDLFWGFQYFIPALFPGWILVIVALLQSESNHRTRIASGIIYVAAFGICFANLLSAVNDTKERELRELFANRLLSDRDVSAEIEFNNLDEQLKKDEFLDKFISQAQNISVSDFHDAIERRVFTGFWEQYEIEVFLFNPDGSGYFGPYPYSLNQFNLLKKLHGSPSDVNENVTYIVDYVKQYAYLFQTKLKEGGENEKTLVLTLKSKRIPEEIGFPRLLISENTQIFEPLEKYSIAKYYKGKLVADYGAYQFPTLLSSFRIKSSENQGYLSRGNFEHFFLKGTGDNYILLSKESSTWVDILTSFSYLFCLFGLILLPGMWLNRSNNESLLPVTLTAKIPMVMISLLFLSLLIYGWGSGVFVRNQYNDYTEDIISEKLSSVYQEFTSKYGDSTLTVQNLAAIEKSLQKYSKIFITDINFYDENGYMVASSRPKVYNIGLISEQMNAGAMTAMKSRNESQFVHKEQIGELIYSSAYQPIYASTGRLEGFLNLQHFGQQKGFEIQIQRFLTAIINVFMFLLTISAVMSIIVTTWLTNPLRILQEKLAAVDFGKLNEPIEYSREDEVGALVKEYNKKISELALTAQQLAKSERESAWREMAKQVAHEIKNPLTPIKLSLQHFQRIYHPEQPLPKEKVDELIASLIEQIDGLTTIANEFSNFAKMPMPTQEKLNFNELLRNVVRLFQQVEDTEIQLVVPQDEVYFLGDKDMFVRVFNNLIKNAIQASSDKKPVVVSLYSDAKKIVIRIVDSGIGISEESKERIFTPYFTTKSTGTGLGLAMVKQMVELHQGTIRFESEANEGTTFIIELPL